jgi:hypothetical protein
MRKLMAAIVACIAALAIPASSQAIVNGSIDGGSHPNVGALTVNNGAQVLACTGTLVSPTVLVTAAHCTAQLEQLGFSQTTVSFDSNIGSGSDITCGLTDCYVALPSKSYVGTLHTDPDFKGSTTGNDSHDIAVVTFDKPIRGITPATLPPAGLFDDAQAAGTFAAQTFTNVGYGWHAIASNGVNATGLFDGVRRFATSGSQSLTTSDIKLTENAALGYGGACSHDSGGPAFLGTSGTIVGLVSGLQGPCSATYNDYRLDTASARAFLANYVTLP